MKGNPSETLMLTGASGNLGQLVLAALLKTPAKHIIAGTRNPAKFVNPAPERVTVRKVDFQDAASLNDAFKGVDRLLIISTDAVDPAQGRGAQHVAAVQAAVKAGVKHIVYTSMTRPEPGAVVTFARDHYLTERALANSPITWTILRNNYYMHMLLQSLPPAIATGGFMSAANNGAVSYVTREDCAAAAAAALTSGATECAMYDITGPQAVTTSELVAAVSKVSGKQIQVAPMSAADYTATLSSFGLPASIAEMIVSLDLSAAKGHSAVVTTAVEELTGAKPKSLAEFLNEHKAMLSPG